MADGVSKYTHQDLSNWTPLKFAEHVKAWGWVERFLQSGTPELDLQLPLLHTNDAAVITAMLEISAAGYMHLLQVLLSRRPALSNCADKDMKRTPLHTAAGSGRPEVVRLLLTAGAKPDVRDASGATPLHVAVSVGSVAVAQILLDAGTDLRALDAWLCTPLARASLAGHARVVKLLLRTEAGRAVMDDSTVAPERPLYLAAQSGNRSVVRELLDAGASHVDTLGSSVLHWAAENGCNLAVRILVAEGVKVEHKDVDGKNVMHFAAAWCSSEVVKMLLQLRVNAAIGDSYGYTPLHYAASTGNIAAIKLLLENPIDVNLCDSRGQTPLHVAANAVVVEILLAAGVNRTAKCHSVRTALHCAAWNGQPAVVQALLTASHADINWYNGEMQTPLYCAAVSGNIVVAILLLTAGADRSLKSKLKLTAYGVAKKKGFSELAHLLKDPHHKKFKDQRTPLHWATECGNDAEVMKLLNYKDVKICAQDADGATALHLAALACNSVTVTSLLSSGAKTTATSKDGCMPLHFAAKAGNVQVVRLLLKAGAQINAQNNQLETALHWAARVGSVRTVEALLEAGADRTMCCHARRTALHWAAWYGRSGVVRKLIMAGIDVNTQDSLGRTSLHCAVHGGSVLTVLLLLASGADKDITDEKGEIAMDIAKKLKRKFIKSVLFIGGPVKLQV